MNTEKNKISKYQEDAERLQQKREEKEIRDIEKLSERLENISKRLELLLKENTTLESYLNRKSNIHNESGFDNSSQDLDKFQNFKKLTLEQKYEIALEEEDYQKKSMEEGKDKSKILIKSLNEMIKGLETMTNEFKKEILEFHREILLNHSDSSNVRVDYYKIVNFRKEKVQNKLVLTNKLKEKEKALGTCYIMCLCGRVHKFLMRNTL